MSTDSVVRLDAVGAEVRIGVHLDVGARREAPPEDGAPRVGQVIGGRYELVRVIGRGAMGAVWLASHQGLGEQVALKLLATDQDTAGLEDALTVRARFRFEAQVAARLSRKTPHIVRVTDYGQEGARAYLVMELLEGETLEACLARRGRMEPREVSTLVTQAARALEIAHAEGVLHRDLKPANIFLAKREDGEPWVKLLDFGVARPNRPHGAFAPFTTAKGVVVGTPGYMSPEQADGSAVLDARADLWSLAAIAYEALTGAGPVEGANLLEMFHNLRTGRIVPLRSRRPELPVKLGRFFEQAFAARVEDRHASSAELARTFADAAAGAHGAYDAAETPSTLRLRWRVPAGARTAAAARQRARPRALISVAAAAVVMSALLFGSWRASADRSPVFAATRAGTMIGLTRLGGVASIEAAAWTAGDESPDRSTSAIAPALTDEAQAPTRKRPRALPENAPRPQRFDYGEFSTSF